jgi:hypothetical protein
MVSYQIDCIVQRLVPKSWPLSKISICWRQASTIISVVIKHTWAYYYPSAFVGWVQVIYIYIEREREKFWKFLKLLFSFPKKKFFFEKEIEGSFEIFLNISFFEMEYRNLINYLAHMCSNQPCTTVIKWGEGKGVVILYTFFQPKTPMFQFFFWHNGKEIMWPVPF